MLLFQTHGHFRIALGTSHRHVWAALFQMLLQLLASRKQLPLTLLPTPEANASQRAWHLDIATLLQLVLNQLLIT